MTGLILTGLAAGLSSALLFGGIASGSLIGVFLFYLTTLPLLIAGLGWGWIAAVAGMVAGAVATGIAVSVPAGLTYAATVGLPASVLSYLALLSRSDSRGGGTEWYPVGRLVMWSTAIGIALIGATLLAIGGDFSAFHEAMVTIINQMNATGGSASPADPGSVDDLVSRIVTLLPAASTMVWIGMTLLNLYIAARVVRASGRLSRPWPEIVRLEVPVFVSLAFFAAAVLTATGGLLGMIAGAALAGLFLCQVLVGLAVVHVMTVGLRVRSMLLFGLYFTTMAIAWPLVFLAILGALEPVLRLRDRTPAPTGTV